MTTCNEDLIFVQRGLVKVSVQLTSTSDSSIFRVCTVVIGDVCTVCKVGFSSITLDIIQEDCSIPLSKVGTPKGSSYVGTVTDEAKPHLPAPYPS